MIVTTVFMFVFICFNVVYVNNNRLSRISYKEVVEVATEKKAEKKLSAPKAPKKETEKKPAKKTKKASPKPKAAPKKLRPALGKA